MADTEKKLFKEWSYERNEEKEELTVLVNDVNGGWKSLATLSGCPTKDMTDEEIDDKYNDLMTEVIDQAGYVSIWTLPEAEIKAMQTTEV